MLRQTIEKYAIYAAVLVIFIFVGWVITSANTKNKITNYHIKQATQVSIDPHSNCNTAYSCTAYVKDYVGTYIPVHYQLLYNDKVIFGHYMKSIEDAEERYEFLLDYGMGKLNYDKVVCDCDTTEKSVYYEQLENVLDEAAVRYSNYLHNKKIPLSVKSGYVIPE